MIFGKLEIKLMAEREIGKRLGKMDLSVGNAARSHDATALKLTDLGLTKTQSSRYQLASSVPQKAFRAFIAETG